MDTLDIRLTIADKINERIKAIYDEMDDIEGQIDALKAQQGALERQAEQLEAKVLRIRDIPDAEVEQMWESFTTPKPTKQMQTIASQGKTCQTWDDWQKLNTRYVAAASDALIRQTAEALDRSGF